MRQIRSGSLGSRNRDRDSVEAFEAEADIEAYNEAEADFEAYEAKFDPCFVAVNWRL